MALLLQVESTILDTMQRLITLRGPIGAGKSSLMRETTRLLPGYSAIEIDALKRMIDPTESSVWRREAALDAGLLLSRLTLQGGRSVITETHSRWPEQQRQFRTVAESVGGVVFQAVLVRAPLAVCLRRAHARLVPGIGYDIDTRMVEEYYTNLDPLPGELLIDTEELSPQEGAQLIANEIARQSAC